MQMAVSYDQVKTDLAPVVGEDYVDLSQVVSSEKEKETTQENNLVFFSAFAGKIELNFD